MKVVSATFVLFRGSYLPLNDMKPDKLPLHRYLILAALVLPLVSDHAQTRATLSPQEQRGKQIYRQGQSGAPEITALLGDARLEAPATAFACVNCHGLRGAGISEGGLQPPPIDWSTLSRPHTSTFTKRERPGYVAAQLTKAISGGWDSAGVPLHPAMPRYRMSREQLDDLIAYLKILGTEADNDPGLTADAIKVGAALPLTGPLSQLGADVKATFAAFFSDLNAHGGLYGRRIDFIAVDSRGDPAETLVATRHLLEQQGVFALVGSFLPGDSSSFEQYLAAQQAPLIGPLTLSPRLSVPPNPYIFYLLPTFFDQARTLVDFARARRPATPLRLGVVYSGNALNADAVAGLRQQARLHTLELVAEQQYEEGKFNAGEAVARLRQTRADHIFFFGGATDLKALAEEMDRAKLGVPLLSCVVMVGRGVFALPAAVLTQTFLSYPSTLPTQNEFAAFLALLRAAAIELRSPAFQSLAYADALLFVEGMKQSGRQVDRVALISALEHLRDFKTGVAPPLTFGPNRRVGVTGSYVVGIDVEKQKYVPLTERLEPKDRIPGQP
jgi:ABC-type branched-subunit amino acid transport system substrate-binding protein